MREGYEINELTRDESWRMFRIIGELVEGFDRLSDVEPAVTIYGSARTGVDDETYRQAEEIGYRLGKLGFSVITGGGPGIMEAANKGAKSAGAKSIGLNIELPEEQEANRYSTRVISFNHFFARKVMLVKYAVAFVIMPGGLGTLDELTEVLTLMQTHKIKPFPVILFDSGYWRGFMDWLRGCVLPKGNISSHDMDLLMLSDSPGEVVDLIEGWYQKRTVAGRKALL